MSTSRPKDDPTAVLDALGVAPHVLLGEGGEASVWAWGEDRVVRVHRAGARRRAVEARADLLREIAAGAAHAPFAVPPVLETRELEGRQVTIEARLPGRSLREVLPERGGGSRARLVRSYMEAAARIGSITIERDAFGDLLGRRPARTSTWRAWLTLAAERSLAHEEGDRARTTAERLAAELPEPQAPALVHLDVFPGNVLVEGDAVTAVLDFGPTSAVGDARFDPITAAAYLDPPISPEANDGDRAVARGWLTENGLDALAAPVRRWLGAYWLGARDVPRLLDWSRSLLRG